MRSRPRLSLRILAGLVALAVCAWFALGVRQAQDGDAASAIISAPGALHPAQAKQAAALLHSAAQLNPDRSVDLLRSHLALREGHPARARAIALAVARAEPSNLGAWLAFNSAAGGQPRFFLLALRHVNELVRFP